MATKSLSPLTSLYKNTQKTAFNPWPSILAANKGNLPELAKQLVLSNEYKQKKGHQWYLMRYKFCQPIVQQLINHVISLSPWNTLLYGCSDFDELYKKIEPQEEIDWVGQLTYYDIALRMVKMYNRKNLMPIKTVYLHASPLYAYRWLYKAGYVSEKPAGRIEYDKIKTDFPGLTADEIEDMLCHFSKLLPSKKKLGKTLGQLSEEESSNIIDDIQIRLYPHHP